LYLFAKYFTVKDQYLLFTFSQVIHSYLAALPEAVFFECAAFFAGKIQHFST
jgi:hypothetical protein